MRFDVISDTTIPDSLEVQNFSHDGKAGRIIAPGRITIVGGPIYGDLLDNVNAATYTLVRNGAFHNSLGVPFDSLGTLITFDIRLPDGAVTAFGVPDQLSFFYLGGDSSLVFTTADPLEAQALFAVTVNGAAGGDLSVFAPMTFIAPDTIALDLQGVDVPPDMPSPGRLRLRILAPNPSRGDVLLAYDLPGAGTFRIRVFDVGGRLVAEPFRGKVEGGVWSAHWAGRDAHGRRLPVGVYIVQADHDGQSAVRRLILVR